MKNERIYILPNHNKKWLKSLLESSNFKSVKKALFVGGIVYSSFVKRKSVQTKIIAVEANPSTIIAQSYIIWLTNNEKNLEKRLKAILLPQKRKTLHLRNLKISQNNYQFALRKFKTFCKESGISDSKKVFIEIFNIKKKGGIFVNLIPKGLDENWLKENSLVAPDRILSANFLEFKERNFQFISTNNVIDNLEPKIFFKKLSECLEKDGFAEITTYKRALPKIPPHFSAIGKDGETIGLARLYRQIKSEVGIEFSRRLVIGRNTIFLRKVA
jgi:hypothetical protein